MVINKYLLNIGKKAGRQEEMCVEAPKLLRSTQRKCGDRAKVWVRTEFAQVPGLTQVKPPGLYVLKTQVFLGLVWVGGHGRKGRARSHQPGSSGVAATPADAGVTTGTQTSGDPQLDPQGRNTEGQTYLCSFTARLMGTCCSWKPQVRRQLCHGSHRWGTNRRLCK